MSLSPANPEERRIVITGLGTVNPLGNTVKEYWENLKAGRSGIRTIQNIKIHDYYIRIAGEVDFPENIREYFQQPKMIKRLDRYIVMSHIAGVQALRNSGLEIEGIAERCGAIIGSGAGGILEFPLPLAHGKHTASGMTDHGLVKRTFDGRSSKNRHQVHTVLGRVRRKFEPGGTGAGGHDIDQ